MNVMVALPTGVAAANQALCHVVLWVPPLSGWPCLVLTCSSAMRLLLSGHTGRQDLPPGRPDCPTGQRSLHHRGDTLETLVLLNPSDKSLCDELRNLLLDPASYKLLVLAGPCLEETGELLLQTGGFSPHHFLQVLKDREVSHPFVIPPFPGSESWLVCVRLCGPSLLCRMAVVTCASWAVIAHERV
ncbi:hypothetical protein P7K49_033592 [Saguinus oedipus]|uniref:Microtubule-associated protein 1B/S N-terminal domain-containing protein n=1 Tax=Saguinus oedipus TaxID=9490 RepID=A0ABQ9TT32_SAGOE|nr:hypothetical protein P7K49_033592 [Saguinus oedipus]